MAIVACGFILFSLLFGTAVRIMPLGEHYTTVEVVTDV
jgi:hypothetical protein